MVEAKPSSVVPNKAIPVSGRVVQADGTPLTGVTVVVKGTTTGTATDPDGSFSLEVPEGATLTFSFVGYVSQEVTVGTKTVLTITLQEDSKALDEVVVVAYGTQQKRAVTGAVQEVQGKELADIPVAQVTQKLQGKLAGVQINQGTGRPGEGMQVRIRGQASINAQGQPLYVVDGFPIVGDISNINPDEIESISVLKDAASASLYGSRAAFGVVLVQTKRARAGQNNLSVNAFYGVQQVPQRGRPDMLNAQEFAQFQKEVYEFNNKPVPAEYQDPSQYGEGTDWYKVLLRQAPIQNYSISLNSNRDKFSTAATLGFFNQQGVILNSGYNRFSARLNADYNFTDKLKFSLNVAPTYAINNGPTTTDGVLWGGGAIMSAILTSPIAPYKNPDGSLPLTATGAGLYPNPNWYRTIQEIEAKTRTTRLLSNASLDYEILKGLSARTTINIDLGQSQFYRFSPSTAGQIFAPPPQKATAQANNSSYYSWLSENLLTYRKTLGDHAFDVLGGYTVQKFRSDALSIAKTDFPDDRVHTLNAATTTSSSSGDIQEWSLLSYLARVNYDFKGKYVLSASIRRDGSSRFGSNNKWGNFPSISAGWIVSDESFMPQVAAVSFLKLRSSYGLTGNNNIGNYPYYALLSPANYVFNNSLANGRSLNSLPNLNLGWERTKQLDFGVDIGLFKNRINFTYDYYHKDTDGLLYSVAIPNESGFNSLLTNLGEFKFWGHEFAINTQNFVHDFKWNTNLNVSFNDNRVERLGNTDAPIYGNTNTTITRVGERIGQFWGFQAQGVYRNAEDLNTSPKYATSAVGTIKMKDINGDGVITNTNDDKTVIGNPWPKFLFGITNNFSYRNIDLSIVSSGSYGNDIMNRSLESTQNLDGVFNVDRKVLNRWRSEQDPGNGIIPSVKAGTTDLARSPNTNWVSDGSYLTIKNITLGYNIPLKEGQHLRNVRVYGSIQQAFVFTSYQGANPEVSAGANPQSGSSGGDALNQGIDWTAYPVPRTFTLGINVGLQ
ncbi:SusC/RagA family TonB-linked outer membrane protein [Hymenobacter crusticola]|uniref:SusC/RagA family TonB-linked outer membrane protein n=1 Tax=Hymenobacter crusticola TaxID=1770526 RepID=A0A243W662_9BACT|nr:SusC/RagA family TonB-linked outer membrane protein [Hymenobacter crusticola]